MYKFTNKRHSREICEWTLDSGKIESVVEIIGKLSRCCGKVESVSQIIGKSARADRIEDFAIQFVTIQGTSEIWTFRGSGFIIRF